MTVKVHTSHVDMGRGPVGYVDSPNSSGRLGVYACGTCGAAIVGWENAANHNRWHEHEEKDPAL